MILNLYVIAGEMGRRAYTLINPSNLGEIDLCVIPPRSEAKL